MMCVQDGSAALDLYLLLLLLLWISGEGEEASLTTPQHPQGN